MAKYTRRSFLQDTLLATAAAATAGSASMSFAKKTTKGSKSPNERLGVAIVGVKGRGKTHIKEFADRNDTEILYVCDPDAKVAGKRAEMVAKLQGRKPKIVADMREAYNDPAVDIASIATPNFWHALASIWAMQHGKDVYVEKPVSHNVSEGASIVEAARKHKKICQMGAQCRSLKGTIDAIDYVQAGKIGDVKLARGLCYKTGNRRNIGPLGDYPVPKHVDYNLYLGPAQMAPLTRPKLHYDWHWQSPYGNGDLGNQGIHQMDIARWGLGLDRLSNRVTSYGGRLGWGDDAGDTANSQVIVHEYDNDKTLVFEVRNLPSDKLLGASIGVVFYGTDGYVVLNSYTKGVALDKNLKVVEKFNGGSLSDHFANFIDAMRSRKHEDLTADILEGHLSSALCHTGNISWELGTEVPLEDVKTWADGYQGNDQAVDTFNRFVAYLKKNKVDPKTTKVKLGPALAFDPVSETFKGNDKANAKLTRDYRKPFVVPTPDKV